MCCGSVMQVLLRHCLDFGAGRMSTMWKVQPDDSGFVTLYLAGSLDNPYTQKRCLAVQGASTQSDTPVVSVPCIGECMSTLTYNGNGKISVHEISSPKSLASHF